MSDEMFEKGLEIRRSVLGADYVDNAIASADDFNKDFQELITSYCWGWCWGRDGLSKRDRSMLNLAMLSSLGKLEELKLHVAGALKNGVTVDEIKEVLMQVAIYAGVPASVSAFKAAREVLEAEGALK